VILLDTNIISETFKPLPEPKVAAWMASVPMDDLFVSSVTKAEMLYGVALLPDGNRKQALASVIERFLRDLLNPVESFDERDAVEYARFRQAHFADHRRRHRRV